MSILAQTIVDHMKREGLLATSEYPTVTPEMVDAILKVRNKILKSEEHSEYSRGIHQPARYVMVKGKRVKIQDGDD